MLLQAAARRSGRASATRGGANDAVASQHAAWRPAAEGPRQALPAHSAWAASAGRAEHLGLPADLPQNPTCHKSTCLSIHHSIGCLWVWLESTGAPASDAQVKAQVEAQQHR